MGDTDLNTGRDIGTQQSPIADDDRGEDEMHSGGRSKADADLPKGRRILHEAPEVPVGAQKNRMEGGNSMRGKRDYNAGAPSSLSVGARRRPGDLEGMIPNMREGGFSSKGGGDTHKSTGREIVGEADGYPGLVHGNKRH